MDIGFSAFYHQFYAADGGDSFGHEVDLVLTKDLGKGFSVLAKWAHFMSNDDAYGDTDRFSPELNYTF